MKRKLGEAYKWIGNWLIKVYANWVSIENVMTWWDWINIRWSEVKLLLIKTELVNNERILI